MLFGRKQGEQLETRQIKERHGTDYLINKPAAMFNLASHEKIKVGRAMSLLFFLDQRMAFQIVGKAGNRHSDIIMKRY
jgi:hypothetical protein